MRHIERRGGVIERIADLAKSKFGVLAVAAVLLPAALAGCSDERKSADRPLTELDVASLSEEDSEQLIRARAMLASVDPTKFNYLNVEAVVNHLNQVGYGSGFFQRLGDAVGASLGDQEQVTETNVRDELEAMISRQASELISENKAEAAVSLVEVGIDDKGNITKESVLRDLAEQQADLDL